MHQLRMFCLLFGTAARQGMVYRTSFWLVFFGTLGVAGGELASVFIVFSHTPAIGGWGVWEVVFMGSLALLPFSLAHLIEGGLNDVSMLVKTGDMDRLLVRPVSPLVQAFAFRGELKDLSRTVAAVIGMTWSLSMLDASLGPLEIAMMAVAVVSGFLVYLALFIAGAATTFWTVDRVEAFNMFTYGGLTLAQYPVSIYRPWLRSLFLFVIPVGFVAYYPSLVILGREDPLGMPQWIGWLAPVAGVVFLAASLWYWRLGVNKYQSTGS